MLNIAKKDLIITFWLNYFYRIDSFRKIELILIKTTNCGSKAVYILKNKIK